MAVVCSGMMVKVKTQPFFAYGGAKKGMCLQ